MSFQVGERVGDYEIVQVLGAGGMGRVFKVRNVISDRVEALKVLLPDLAGNAELADRFLREIKVQASLVHPNIASLYTAMRHGNQLLMVMEFVEGQSVDDLLKKAPLTPNVVADVARQALGALGYAHSRGVVHRDIKPPNIMVTRDGAVKLMDFGIARMKEDKQLTQTGMTVGSLYYMSPEQIRGESVDARSDIYSFGITLYEMVTGRRPFQGSSDFSIMAAHLQQAPVPPIELDPRVPQQLSEVILMAIAKDPAQRFQTASAFSNALQGLDKTTIASGPVEPPKAAPPVGPTPAPPPVVEVAGPKKGVYVGAGVLAAALVVGILAVNLLKSNRAEAEPSRPPANPVAEAPAPQPRPVEQPSAPVNVTPEPEPAAKPLVQHQPKPTEAKPVQETKAPPVAQAVRENPGPREGATQVESAPPVSSPPPAAQPAAATVSRPAPAGTRELDDLHDRLMKLGIRIGTIRQKVRPIAQQQAAQGVGMRSDVTGGLSIIEYQMDQAAKQIDAGSASSAKTALDRAEMQVEKLEKILGI